MVAIPRPHLVSLAEVPMLIVGFSMAAYILSVFAPALDNISQLYDSYGVDSQTETDQYFSFTISIGGYSLPGLELAANLMTEAAATTDVSKTVDIAANSNNMALLARRPIQPTPSFPVIAARTTSAPAQLRRSVAQASDKPHTVLESRAVTSPDSKQTLKEHVQALVAFYSLLIVAYIVRLISIPVLFSQHQKLSTGSSSSKGSKSSFIATSVIVGILFVIGVITFVLHGTFFQLSGSYTGVAFAFWIISVLFGLVTIGASVFHQSKVRKNGHA